MHKGSVWFSRRLCVFVPAECVVYLGIHVGGGVPLADQRHLTALLLLPPHPLPTIHVLMESIRLHFIEGADRCLSTVLTPWCHFWFIFCWVTCAKDCLFSIKCKLFLAATEENSWPVSTSGRKPQRFLCWPVRTLGDRHRASPASMWPSGCEVLINGTACKWHFQALCLKPHYSLGYHISLIIHCLTFFQM